MSGYRCPRLDHFPLGTRRNGGRHTPGQAPRKTVEPCKSDEILKPVARPDDVEAASHLFSIRIESRGEVREKATLSKQNVHVREQHLPSALCCRRDGQRTRSRSFVQGDSK